MYGVGIFFCCLFLLVAVWFGVGTRSALLSPALPQVATTTSRADADRILDDAFASGEASPFRGLITFREGTSRPNEARASAEYLILRASRELPGSTSLDGWAIETGAGERMPLPHAVEILATGEVNAPAPAVIGPDQEIIVASGRSPLGYSFRENLCTGYLEEHQDFAPMLQIACPYPSDELARSGNGDEACRSYASRMDRCTTSTDAPSALSCAAFIEQALTYNGCVAAHRAEPGFLAPTWRLFLGRSSDAYDDERDTLRLLDGNGKIVDVLSY